MIRCSKLGELRALLMAQGHQYLNTHIADLYIRQAVDEFVGDHPWPWRRVTVTDDEGVEFAGLDIVDQVIAASGASIAQADRDQLVDSYGGLISGVGSPIYWYAVGDVVYTYPRSLDQLTVIYFTRYGWINQGGTVYKARPNSDTDTPICPARCEEIVLLGARVRAKTEAQDFEQAAGLREQYETRVEEERSRPDQVDEFRTIRVTQGDWA